MTRREPPSGPTSPDGPSTTIEHRSLRSAIEFAVAIVREAGKQRTRIDHPVELDRFVTAQRIPNGALGRLRRAIEDDATFRERLSAGAIPELVDEIGRLWLAAAPGWQEPAAKLQRAAAERVVDDSLRAQLQRAERQRDAAERAVSRSRADAIAARAALDEATADLSAARRAAAETQRQLAESDDQRQAARRAERHALDRERAALDRLASQAQSTPADATVEATSPAVAADAARGLDPAALAEIIERAAAEIAALRQLVEVVHEEPAPDAQRRARVRAHRRPLRLPGGVISTSAEAAEFLLRSGALVLVDGYNVAKRGWPEASLDDQRRHLLTRLENLAAARGVEVVVVFDGADVVGAHADARRRLRVVYSPAGVTADDVIRDHVGSV
ncbi:MAG: NYN domain-containing protein, partial [Actinomycetota bacterium]